MDVCGCAKSPAQPRPTSGCGVQHFDPHHAASALDHPGSPPQRRPLPAPSLAKPISVWLLSRCRGNLSQCRQSHPGVCQAFVDVSISAPLYTIFASTPHLICLSAATQHVPGAHQTACLYKHSTIHVQAHLHGISVVCRRRHCMDAATKLGIQLFHPCSWAQGWCGCDAIRRWRQLRRSCTTEGNVELLLMRATGRKHID